MKRLSLLIILCSSLAVYGQTTKVGKQSHSIMKVVEMWHYSPKPFDDDLSEYVFEEFIATIDPGGYYLLQGDIDALKTEYGTNIDNEIKGKTSYFFKDVAKVYKKRLKQADSLITDITKKSFDFEKEEYLSYKEGERKAHEENLSDLRERWRKWLKYATLEEIFEGDYVKNPLDTTKKVLLNATDEALDHVVKEERFEIAAFIEHPAGYEEYLATYYLDVIAGYFDPHTTYFSDIEKQSFEEDLSSDNKAYGFTLVEDEQGNILIDRLVPGSSAWISNSLNKGDIIVKLKLDTKAKTFDVTQMSLEEIELLLKTEDDQSLIMTVQKGNGRVEDVPLSKAEIYVEDDVIKSVLLEGEKKIGYITLPDFYTDWDDLEGLGCANDVAKNLIKLKKENIDGLILDLRNNGGGSVKEAIELAGIFINYGPISIVQHNDQDPESVKDMNKGAIFMGPLAILVNHGSASASEFFAAAMQDYNRGIIVGSQTYGKASGQFIMPLDPSFNILYSDMEDIDYSYGYLKVTRSKYYRITNKSHQKEGITPDVKIRDYYELYEYGEIYNEMALEADDVVKKVYYTPFPDFPSSRLQSNSDFRLSSNIPYQELCTAMDTIADFTDYNELIPLDIVGFQKNEKIMDDLLTRLFTTEQQADNNFEVDNHQFDKEILKINDYRRALNETYLENVRKDMYIGEAYYILEDYINSKQ